MPHSSATRVLDELIAELGPSPGPRERVVDELIGNLESNPIGSSTVYPVLDTTIHKQAHTAVAELRRTWGPTADPHWVDGIVPGRGQHSDQSEFDCFFALFHRNGFWGYVRIRAPETDTPANAYLRLVFGVVKDSDDPAA